MLLTRSCSLWPTLRTGQVGGGGQSHDLEVVVLTQRLSRRGVQLEKLVLGRVNRNGQNNTASWREGAVGRRQGKEREDGMFRCSCSERPTATAVLPVPSCWYDVRPSH